MTEGKYSELVYNNYYGLKEQAKLYIDTTVKTIFNCYKKIIDDNDFLSIQDKVDQWNAMLDTINSKSTELYNKMDQKYDEMIQVAKKLDGWVHEAKTLKTNYSTTACQTIDDMKTNKTEYFVVEVGEDGEGYPTITYKKIVTGYTAVYQKDVDGNQTTTIDHYSLNSTSTDSLKTFSIRTEDDYKNYISNVSSVSF